MSLHSAYLEYAHRRLGYDHDLYTYMPLPQRRAITWPGGKRVATCVVVSLEWFPITPFDKPFRAPGHMQTAYPDYRHYTAREYGTRVGLYRLLDAFERAQVAASFALNGAIAQRYPVILRDIVTAGHEVIAHSTDMNGTIDSSVDIDTERQLIAQSVEQIAAITGTSPRGWLSIARSQSWNTPQLLKDAQFDYCCDWVNDELPWMFANGLVNLPLNQELSDRQILTVQQQSVDSYAEQVLDAFDWLTSEAEQQGAGRMLPLHVTPYIIGLPYRMDAFERLLGSLASRRDNWLAKGSEIVDSFRSSLT